MEAGAIDAVPTTLHAHGGNGATALADAVMQACDEASNFDYLYPMESTFEEKMNAVVQKVYGVDLYTDLYIVYRAAL